MKGLEPFLIEKGLFFRIALWLLESTECASRNKHYFKQKEWVFFNRFVSCAVGYQAYPLSSLKSCAWARNCILMGEEMGHDLICPSGRNKRMARRWMVLKFLWIIKHGEFFLIINIGILPQGLPWDEETFKFWELFGLSVQRRGILSLTIGLSVRGYGCCDAGVVIKCELNWEVTLASACVWPPGLWPAGLPVTWNTTLLYTYFLH